MEYVGQPIREFLFPNSLATDPCTRPLTLRIIHGDLQWNSITLAPSQHNQEVQMFPSLPYYYLTHAGRSDAWRYPRRLNSLSAHHTDWTDSSHFLDTVIHAKGVLPL